MRILFRLGLGLSLYFLFTMPLQARCGGVLALVPPGLRIGTDQHLNLSTSSHTYAPGEPGSDNPYSYEFLEAASPFIQAGKSILILGAGSGYEAIAIAKKFPSVSITASDISNDALRDLEINLEEYGLSESVRVLKSDLFNDLKGEKFDVILFTAPRPLCPDLLRLGPLDAIRLVSSLSRCTSNFDSWGTIHERALTQFEEHLSLGGSLILLTDKRFPHSKFVSPQIKKTVLGEGLWTPNHEKDGHFQIVRFH